MVSFTLSWINNISINNLGIARYIYNDTNPALSYSCSLLAAWNFQGGIIPPWKSQPASRLLQLGSHSKSVMIVEREDWWRSRGLSFSKILWHMSKNIAIYREYNTCTFKHGDIYHYSSFNSCTMYKTDSTITTGQAPSCTLNCVDQIPFDVCQNKYFV